MLSKLKMVMLVGVGALCVSAFGANAARPGTVNYVEGAAFFEGKQLNQHDVGSVNLDAGQVLTTEQGRAEILLTPGVFLRLDDHSSVRIISPNLTLTQVELGWGRAAVEVDEVYKQNNLQVIAGGVATRLLKTGYYVFTAAPTSAQAPVRASVRVFQGKATVMVGKGKFVEIKGHRELALTDSATQQPVKIDTRAAKDDFYNWNSLRSQYLAEANNQIAGYYTGVAGFYPGWYWNPYMWNYTFIGMDPYWSPFGYGFYPPWWGGYYGGGYRNPGSRLHGDPGSAHPGGGAGSHIGSGFSGMGGGGMYSGGGGAGGHH